MNIYGIGSTFNDVDYYKEFVNHRIAAIGWNKEEAQPLYSILSEAAEGELIYIKGSPIAKSYINIKAIGLILSTDIHAVENWDVCKNCFDVLWLWVADDKFEKIELSSSDYKNNVYNNTFYREYSSNVKEKLFDILDVNQTRTES